MNTEKIHVFPATPRDQEAKSRDMAQQRDCSLRVHTKLMGQTSSAINCQQQQQQRRSSNNSSKVNSHIRDTMISTHKACSLMAAAINQAYMAARWAGSKRMVR